MTPGYDIFIWAAVFVFIVLYFVVRDVVIFIKGKRK